ncbi:hypothetical protein DICPUDRAFT_97329 [Dictyostelium purpureum]|uniref:Transmembrane protein 115 n=1 Tax=Dictyostelium purpureum TaxID=5786 RepID=F0ZFT0_DICPU|nr:uncharacterized protein DICPUDRAFT_97329 [Dictyostelium purpureum]EGC37228.1 hypothetical protein DICPUDRAFT_97329 [Dictyostelium purpureum]|eukprot:XP_003286279.1 hypothetical protein DICPUDRAFT_97329 [Dictyostelium purpureum]
METLNSFPRLTKTVAGVLSFFLILNLLFRPISFFTINVAYIAPPYFFVWTLFTAGLYDTNFLNGIINIILLLYIGKHLEPIWGSKEFIKFIAIVNFFSGVCSFFFFIFLYIFSNVFYAYETNVCGFSGVIIGFSVAAKQLIPEQELALLFLKVRAKWLPSIFILIRLVLFLFVGFSDKSFTLVLFGVLVAWVYLRFYQLKGGVKGDLNESFSFATFFPEPIQPPIKTFSNIVFKILCKFSICENRSILPTTQNSSFSNDQNNLNYSAADMDRRRALAVKALEQRMQQQQHHPQAQPQQPMLPQQPQTPQNNTNDEDIK